jgi:hypothetical protein
MSIHYALPRVYSKRQYPTVAAVHCQALRSTFET